MNIYFVTIIEVCFGLISSDVKFFGEDVEAAKVFIEKQYDDKLKDYQAMKYDVSYCTKYEYLSIINTRKNDHIFKCVLDWTRIDKK